MRRKKWRIIGGVIFNNGDVMFFDENTSIPLSNLYIPTSGAEGYGVRKFLDFLGTSHDFTKPPQYFKLKGSKGYPVWDNALQKYDIAKYNEEPNGQYDYYTEYNNNFYYKKGDWILTVHRVDTLCDEYDDFLVGALNPGKTIVATTKTGERLVQPAIYEQLADNSELAAKWKKYKLTSDPSDGSNIKNDDVISCFAGPRRKPNDPDIPDKTSWFGLSDNQKKLKKFLEGVKRAKELGKTVIVKADAFSTE
jgi:hypothetical protein